MVHLLATLLLGLAPIPQDTAEVVETWEDGTPKVRRLVRREADGTEVNHGKFTSWHPNGEVESEGRYADGLRSGRWVFRWENGRRREQGKYAAGHRDGAWNSFWPSGDRSARGAYSKGHRTGEWTFWDEQKGVRADLSGVYGHHDHEEREFGCWAGGSVFDEDLDHGDLVLARWVGNSLDGLKHGPWTLHRADGSVAFSGRYERGVATGPWVFLHADGSFDQGWLSGIYEGGERVAPLTELPSRLESDDPHAEPDLARVADLDTKFELLDRVDRTLRGDAVARAALFENAQSSYCHVLQRLLRTDFSTEDGEVAARRLLELIGSMNGTEVPWPEDSIEEKKRTILRLHSFWELARADQAIWTVEFAPAWHWAQTEFDESSLANPPPPSGFGESRPRDPRAVSGRFGGRFGGRRNLRARGGLTTSKVLLGGLEWLAGAQGDSGSWNPGDHGGDESFTVGTTALCLLAFLGDGNTLDRGPYKRRVDRGARWLAQQVDRSSGEIPASDEAGLLEHVLAAQVLSETAFFSSAPRVLRVAQAALDHLVSARLPDGSIPIRRGDDRGDPLVTGNAIIVLLGAREAGLEVEDEVIAAALAWLDASTAADGAVRAGRVSPFVASTSASASALACLSRSLARREPIAGTPTARTEVWLAENPLEVSARSERADPMFAFFGSYACFQLGGEVWETWNARCRDLVVQSFQEVEDGVGFWEPVGEWSRGGGRLLSTAARCLTLEVYFRYSRIPR